MSKPTPHFTSLPDSLLAVCVPLLMREAKRVRKQNDRALRRGRAATLTFPQWIRIVAYYEWKCAYCRKKPYECVEHLNPLHAGGGTTADNVAPSCEECNHRYGDMYYRQHRLTGELQTLALLA